MKRALKKRVKAVLENTTGEETPVESSNLLECGSVRRKRTQAAMIGLAISMGASSLLVTRQSDQALAAAPVGNQNTASTTSAADNFDVKGSAIATSNSVSASRVSAPENPVVVEPTAVSQLPGLGAKWQVAARSLPTQYPQSGITSQSPAPLNSESAIAPNKGERIAAAIAKTKQIKTPQSAVIPTSVVGIAKSSVSTPVDAELKAQQEYAIKHLQQKSDRLRASLAQLRSEEASEPLTASAVQTQTQPNANQDAINPRFAQLRAASAQINQSTTEFAIAPKQVYEVKPGDTLAAIANHNGTSVAALIAANNITNPHQLQIRQKLTIPVAAKQQVINTQVPVAATRLQPISVAPASTNASETLVSANTGMGGDSPVPRVFAEMERRKNANKQAKVDPGLQSLQAEIERLRQKYREQQSGKRGNAPDNRRNSVTVPVQTQSRPVAIPVPTARQNQIPAPVRTNNYFNYNAAPVQIPVPRPQAQPSYANQQPVNSEWARRNAGNNVQIPVPSVDASRSLGNMRGINVSPQLPPLAAVDRYLPQPVEENTPISNGYIWPAKGALTSGYGRRWGRMHRGIDIANSVGTPIYAASAGVVEKAGWNNGGYGYLVDIRHSDGSLSRYAHNSRIVVQAGQTVQQGQQISAMGSTGFSTGPHLHFEIHPSGKGAVNPIALLPPRV